MEKIKSESDLLGKGESVLSMFQTNAQTHTHRHTQTHTHSHQDNHTICHFFAQRGGHTQHTHTHTYINLLILSAHLPMLSTVCQYTNTCGSS